MPILRVIYLLELFILICTFLKTASAFPAAASPLLLAIALPN